MWGKEFHIWQPLFKRIIAQQHDLCEMKINHLGHVLFCGYVFAELVQIYISQDFRAISLLELKTVVAVLKSTICFTLSGENL